MPRAWIACMSEQATAGENATLARHHAIELQLASVRCGLDDADAAGKQHGKTLAGLVLVEHHRPAGSGITIAFASNASSSAAGNSPVGYAAASSARLASASSIRSELTTRAGGTSAMAACGPSRVRASRAENTVMPTQQFIPGACAGTGSRRGCWRCRSAASPAGRCRCLRRRSAAGRIPARARSRRP